MIEWMIEPKHVTPIAAVIEPQKKPNVSLPIIVNTLKQ